MIRDGRVKLARMLVGVALLGGMLAWAGCGGSSADVSVTEVASRTTQSPATTAKTNPGTAVTASTSMVLATQPGASSPTDASTTGGSTVTTHGAATSTSQVATTTTRATTTTTARLTTTTKPTTPTTVAAIVLEVTGPSGTKSYTLAQLKAKPAVSGYWGAHKDTTSINRYSGVPLLDLLAEVGGLPSGKGLRISASDSFACDYEPQRLEAMANGTYQMWDCNGTLVTWADDIETAGSVQMVVAYAVDGKSLPTSGEGAGPLRVVLIQDSQSMLTEGKYSPYLVTSIVVR
jgi:hypothetical protein